MNKYTKMRLAVLICFIILFICLNHIVNWAVVKYNNLNNMVEINKDNLSDFKKDKVYYWIEELDVYGNIAKYLNFRGWSLAETEEDSSNRKVELILFNKEKQYAEIRKGIARKIRKDVFSVANDWTSTKNDERLLEAIPDDLVVTIADSHSSGNCVPGTQAFVDQYFPGKTETTAGELKKYSDKWEVMRVFRYIAKRDQIVGKVKLDIPA